MYGKVFESMYDGTLSADWKAMVTFQQFIVLADSQGVVDYTPPALSRRTGIPLDILEHGIEKLQQPDKYSRSPEMDGQRIELIDDHRPWGWHIVNYEHYKRLASREDKREKDRKRMENKRKPLKKQGCRNVSQPVANVAYEDVDVNGDVDKEINPSAWGDYEKHRKEKKKPITPLSKTKQQNVLRKYSHDEQRQIIDKAIANGWVGLYPPEKKPVEPSRYQEL